MNTAAPEKKLKLNEDQVKAWLSEVDSAKKREKTWREESQKIISLYEGYKREQSPFNILFSNTDTLLPALYNNTPRPAIGRRFKDKDPLGAAVSLTMNRTLIFTMDSNNAGEPDFDELVNHAVLQALVPGRGVVRFKYDADVNMPEVEEKESTYEAAQEIRNTPAEGDAIQSVDQPAAPEALPTVQNERVCGETVEYDRFTHGYAKKWRQVPWVCFEHSMTEEELKKNFGDAVGGNVTCTTSEKGAEEGEEVQKDHRKVATVYEIWNKDDRTVLFISPGYTKSELKCAEDPLDLSGFFPMDEPLHFLGKLSGMVPQPIYNLYKVQAEELNIVTRRIIAITKALKVRGGYNSELTELEKILKADDNELVAIENTQILGENMGLSNAIYLMPLGELVSVLQQLYLQRTQIKQVIYEITGISDILRGSTVASETATAQSIKNQWGTLRLKSMQKKVARWCRNNVRIMAEIAAKKFSQPTFQRMTGLPYITMQQKQQAEMAMQQFQQQQQQQAMQPPAPGQPPASPQPPAPPPQQLVDALATPVWEEVIGLMRDTVGMEFRVDIETNSTIADDMAEDQKNIGELLNALSQFLNGVAPLIENGAMPFEVAKTIMLGIVRKMAMGPEIEDQLDKMQAPKPPEPPAPPPPPPPPPLDPNLQLKQQSEAAKIQGDMMQQQMAQKMAELEMQAKQQEGQLRQREFENKMIELQQKREVADEKFRQQMMLAKAKASQPSTPTSGA